MAVRVGCRALLLRGGAVSAVACGGCRSSVVNSLRLLPSAVRSVRGVAGVGSVRKGAVPQQWYGDPFVDLSAEWNRGPKSRTCNTDAFLQDNNFILRMDCPGCTREGMQVEFDENKNTLHVLARVADSNVTAADADIIVHERDVSSYHRSFRLPANVNSDHIECEYRDGVLTISMPLNNVQMVNRKLIPVQVGADAVIGSADSGYLDARADSVSAARKVDVRVSKQTNQQR